MPTNAHLQQQQNVRLLLSGVLAASILWLLAAWILGEKIDYVSSDSSHNGVLVSVDMPLHANSEHTFTIKRFFNRAKDRPKSAEPADVIWALVPAEYSVWPFSSGTTQSTSAISLPHVCLHQLHALNAPRAPPLV